jgi:CheY-like chemotaxis protein
LIAPNPPAEAPIATMYPPKDVLSGSTVFFGIIFCNGKGVYIYKLKTIFYLAVKTKIKILLIEDDEDDVDLLKETLDAGNIPNEMDVIGDGNEAVEFLTTCTSCPDVIVLDYNLPKVHGREILREIKNRGLLKPIPVIVLTTSSSREDIEYAYKMGASKFLIKPVTMEQMKLTASTIADVCFVDNKEI